MCVLGSRVKVKNTRNVAGSVLERQYSSAQPQNRKRLDPVLRSWLDNVIIPALVRDYLAEMEKQNRLATTGSSELPSDQDGKI
jgi:hypothetical protein